MVFSLHVSHSPKLIIENSTTVDNTDTLVVTVVQYIHLSCHKIKCA